MTSKKIVKEFTPENSSYLHHGDDNDIISSWITIKDPEESHNTIFTPTKFNDLENIHNLRKKYSQNNLKTPLLRKIVSKIGDKELDTEMVLTWMSLVFGSLSILFAEVSYTYIDNTFNIENDILLKIFTIITFIIMLLSFSGITVRFCEKNNTILNEEKYNLTKNTRKQLHNTIFLKLPINTTNSIKNTHNNIMSKINQLFSYDEDILNTIDFYDLKNSYNEYVQLLTFMVINEDTISLQLYDEYVEHLEELARELNKKIDNTLTIIKVKKDFVHNNEKEISDLNQEMLDNDALSFFPINNKEKVLTDDHKNLPLQHKQVEM